MSLIGELFEVVPAAFMRVERLPRTPNGKIDRALNDRCGQVLEPARSVAAPSALEAAVAAIRQRSLGVAETSASRTTSSESQPSSDITPIDRHAMAGTPRDQSRRDGSVDQG